MWDKVQRFAVNDVCRVSAVIQTRQDVDSCCSHETSVCRRSDLKEIEKHTQSM